jgi:hypothetical protein
VSATREQYAKSTAIKTNIIAALRDNVGEEYTAAEIAQAMTSPLDIDVRQVGAILKVMAADGLVETRTHRNMHIYRLLEPALTWEPKPYRRTPSVVESKKAKETPQVPKGGSCFDTKAWTAYLADVVAPSPDGNEACQPPTAATVRGLPKLADSEKPKKILVGSKKAKKTPQVPKGEAYFDFAAWTDRLADVPSPDGNEACQPPTAATAPEDTVKGLPKWAEKQLAMWAKPPVKVVGEVALPVLSNRWTADLCLNIRSVPSFAKLDSPFDDREDKIKLKVVDDGAGYFCVVKMDSVADPGDLDFLPAMIEGLIHLMEGLCPTEYPTTKKVPE